MNVLYSCCIQDPWIKVAKELLSHNLIPKYWIGWPEENPDNIKKEFTDVTFHDINDAWRGIFPENINIESVAELDGAMLNSLAKEELIAMRMMERQDPTHFHFTFNDRQRFFRFLLSRWLFVLKEENINLIISPSIPHRVFDYVIYIAAKQLGIKIVMFKMTVWPGFLIPVFDIDKLPKLVFNYKDDDIASEVKLYVNRVTGDYLSAEPKYMKKQKESDKMHAINRMLKRIDEGEFRKSLKKIFGLYNIYWKKHKVSIYDSRYSYLKYQILREKYIKYKKALKTDYEKLCDHVDENDKYFFVALHYQPEETTSPSGGVFVDQVLLVENMAKYLPKGVKIYVKEHSSQFHPLMEGESGRDLEYYKLLKKIPNVKLISTKINSFELIDNSLATVTVTGTVGVESLLRGKPVFIFGNAWYQDFTGVFKYIDGGKLREDMLKCAKGYKFDINKVILELNTIYKSAIKAYHYKGYKELSGIKEESSVKELVGLVSKAIEV